MQGRLGRIILYRGIVARRDSMSEAVQARRATPLFFGYAMIRGLQFNDLLLDGSRRLVRGGQVGETANHGDHAFLGPRSCQNPATTRDRLGKSPAEPANHGHRALLDCDHAEPSDNAIGWEKCQRKPPIMAISLFWDALTPNHAAIRDFWEKFRGNRQSWPSRFF